jgi:hypothetical protein
MKWFLLKLWRRCFKLKKASDLHHIAGIMFGSGLDEDLEGQVLIYTDFRETKGGDLEPFDPEYLFCRECNEPVHGRHLASCGKRAAGADGDYVFAEDCE